MGQGIIQDFYTAVKGPEKSVVKLLIAGEEENACSICAEIPNDALKYDMVKAGSSISWEHSKVYIDIEGVEEVPFKKIGTPGDVISFYEHVKLLKKVG